MVRTSSLSGRHLRRQKKRSGSKQVPLKLYSIFHVNLFYSSIPESRRPEVIKHCLWPLLELAIRHKFPIAIESPAATLELISRLDKEWVQSLREAIRSRLVEFVGSGYSQIVAPLVPAEVNQWNLEIGKQEYKRILSTVPSLWYVNEQAYSAGIVEHYMRLGVDGIVMEWNNPRTLHPEWDDGLKYYPQVAAGPGGQGVPLIWNDSITFQKFQRYAHGDIEIGDLLAYLATHVGEEGRYHCLYGNDAEIFDFRPGRFRTEPEFEKAGEWSRIARLYQRLQSDPRFQIIFPSEVLKSPAVPSASFQSLRLESAAQPITVKKQPKYNVTRWSVTGRNSLYVNTLCHRLYRCIKSAGKKDPQTCRDVRKLKKMLCYFWSSDFRTHITSERWDNFVAEIEGELRKTVPDPGTKQIREPYPLTITANGLCATFIAPRQRQRKNKSALSGAGTCKISTDRRFVQIATPSVVGMFNLKRGLAVQSLLFPRIYPAALAGTIPHGYFDDIALSADWYSGNTVLQRPGESQITDLAAVDIETIAGWNGGEKWLGLSAVVPTEAGSIRKSLRIFVNRPQIDFDYTFEWGRIPAGSFKTAFVTLMPESYDPATLFFATHNGGPGLEMFRLHGQTVAHNVPASSVVTASTGLGATEGIVIIGDARKALAINFDPSVCASMPMVAFRQTGPSFFARVMFSCGELDESCIGEVPGPLRFVCSIVGMGRTK
jgi:hypothetical protein